MYNILQLTWKGCAMQKNKRGADNYIVGEEQQTEVICSLDAVGQCHHRVYSSISSRTVSQSLEYR